MMEAQVPAIGFLRDEGKDAYDGEVVLDADSEDYWMMDTLTDPTPSTSLASLVPNYPLASRVEYKPALSPTPSSSSLPGSPFASQPSTYSVGVKNLQKYNERRNFTKRRNRAKKLPERSSLKGVAKKRVVQAKKNTVRLDDYKMDTAPVTNPGWIGRLLDLPRRLISLAEVLLKPRMRLVDWDGL